MDLARKFRRWAFRLGWAFGSALVVEVLLRFLDANIDDVGKLFRINSFLSERGLGWWATMVDFSHTQLFAFLGGLAMALVLFSLVGEILDRIETRGHRRSPLLVRFTPEDNKDAFIKRCTDEDYGATLDHYNFEVTNTSAKTIRSVRAKIMWDRGYIESKRFLGDDSETCDLHPGSSAFVRVYTYSDMADLNDDYRPKANFVFHVSGLDTAEARVPVSIDDANPIALSLSRWVHV